MEAVRSAVKRDGIFKRAQPGDGHLDGRIVASIPGKDANENELGLMMAGGGKKE